MNVMHCAVIDLESGSASVLEAGKWALSVGNLGWNVHPLNRIHPLDDTAFTAISTGPLTGTGAPGSGGFTWCNFQSSGKMFYPAEGRLGPALRFAGLDHLIFTGKCPDGVKADVVIHDSRITVTYVRINRTESAAKAYERAQKRRPSEDSVIVIPSPSGVLEDDHFFISDKITSSLLRAMGVHSLTVASSGAIPIAEPGEFCALVSRLWSARRGLSAADAEHPARCLSVHPGIAAGAAPVWPAAARLKAGDPERQLLAALGLYWEGYAAELGGLETAAQLLSLGCGKDISAAQLRLSGQVLDRALTQ